MNAPRNERQAAQVFQLMPRGELHRAFPAIPPRRRGPRPAVVATRLLIAGSVIGFVYCVFRFRLWEIWKP